MAVPKCQAGQLWTTILERGMPAATLSYQLGQRRVSQAPSGA